MTSKNTWAARAIGISVLLLAVFASEIAASVAPGMWTRLPEVWIVWGALLAAATLLVTEGLLLRTTGRLRALHDLARRLAQPLELQAMLDAALGHSVELTRADAGCIYLCDGQELFLGTARGLHPEFRTRHARINPDKRLAAGMLSGDATRLESGPIPAPFDTMLPSGSVGSGILVPIAAGGVTLGVMVLAYRARRRFLEDDLETLGAIGAQLATAATNSRSYNEALREARTDPLTGLGSRRLFEDHFRRELSRARRTRASLSLAVLDLDGLKWINDTHGHAMGDRVLQAVAGLLKHMRGSDVVARLGGDEFVVLMPETCQVEGEAAVRRFREGLAALNAEGKFPFPIRVSAGVRDLNSVGVMDILAEADRAMYEDKVAHRREMPGENRLEGRRRCPR